MNLLVLILILWSFHHEKTQDVGKIEQTIVLENRVEDAQEKCIWRTDAWRYPPVKEVHHALLPPSNCVAFPPP